MTKLTLAVGKTYFTASDLKVTITEAIGIGDVLDYAAGYRFRSATGRNYTAAGDHNDSDLVLVREVPAEAFSATVTFSHGLIEIKGTMIFILATVAEQEKREGFRKTVFNDSLKTALAAAKERVSSRVSKHV